MPLLKKEPSGVVHSLAELFAIAFALEEEAASRYRDLAIKMREHDAPDAAAVFEHLAEEERGHRDQVTHWSEKRTGKPPEAAEVKWELPDTFDDEAAADLAGSRLATPYRALSMAVRNEERAFAFWTYVAAHAEDAAVREAAETMASEELEHVSLLRRERRRAYHAHRASVGQTVPRQFTATDALREAAVLERRLADLLDSDAAGPASDRERMRAMAGESRQMAEEIASLGPAPAKPVAEPASLMATAEQIVERYLEAADHARDEATLGQAQSLARRAIVRLARLRNAESDAKTERSANKDEEGSRSTPARWPM